MSWFCVVLCVGRSHGPSAILYMCKQRNIVCLSYTNLIAVIMLFVTQNTILYRKSVFSAFLVFLGSDAVSLPVFFFSLGYRILFTSKKYC